MFKRLAAWHCTKAAPATATMANAMASVMHIQAVAKSLFEGKQGRAAAAKSYTGPPAFSACRPKETQTSEECIKMRQSHNGA